MIAISESLIRSVRSFSYDDEKQQPTEVERLLGSSPSNIPKQNHNLIDQSESKQATTTNPRPDLSLSTQVSNQMKIVKFNQEFEKKPPPAQENPSPFVKEPVKPTLIASSLSKELSETGVLRTMKSNQNNFSSESSSGDNSFQLKVFHAPGDPPIKVGIPPGFCKVEDAIDIILREITTNKNLKSFVSQQYFRQPDAYELRMVDDEDGTPDDDMPALVRSANIHKTGGISQGVALVMKSGVNLNLLPASPTGGRKLSLNEKPNLSGKFFIKVHMANESHVIPMTNRETKVLEDLLPILAKKKKINTIDSKQYKFLYLDETDISTGALEMKTLLSELRADEVKLVHKFGDQNKWDESKWDESKWEFAEESQIRDPQEIQFTKETACSYQEYKVVKTNQRGRKQKRIMGIDQNYIYNRSQTSASDKFNVVSSAVQKKQRPFHTIASCNIIKNKPRGFQINFREKNTIVTRDYEAETKMECAEIVARINFLLQLHQSGTGTQL